MSNAYRVITAGNSFAVTLPVQYCRLLSIDQTTELVPSIEEGCIVYRPVRKQPTAPTSSPVGEALRFRELERLMESLDMHGLSKRHFERIRHDTMDLLEFVGRIGLGRDVDPVTVQRLQKCLERQTTRREAWESTITAVLAEFPSTP
jgi:antitoxin component of MazEF toxin-antitoxin module